jgi:hypothetical protein
VDFLDLQWLVSFYIYWFIFDSFPELTLLSKSDAICVGGRYDTC